jgi:hypothetical protein
MADAIRIPGWHQAAMPSMDKVRSVFSASVMAKDVLKLYRDLLERRGGRKSKPAS